jgi:hypothetical protein
MDVNKPGKPTQRFGKRCSSCLCDEYFPKIKGLIIIGETAPGKLMPEHGSGACESFMFCAFPTRGRHKTGEVFSFHFPGHSVPVIFKS